MFKKLMSLIVVCLSLGFFTSANAIVIESTYTDLGSKSLIGVSSSTLLEFSITNNTGVTWTDFHINNTNYGALSATSYEGPGTADFGDTIDSILGVVSQTLDIFDISVANDEVLSFNVNYVCAGEICSSGFGTFIFGYPTVGEEPPRVPEPSALLLLAAGLLGFGFVGRKQKA